ncbi:hypothetical protein J2X46_000532 [Nocardioides sp. BE266]|uniref:hypothetical protein n=1 Tax=Nocardioides sp. BE266 TaxID=2817725 RepID=UPI002866A18A|nr:hypothetical protein [Nocardioides sp. BE266]MDR7251560.1 hypothetical protein [Nocardioides sp. BE266]
MVRTWCEVTAAFVLSVVAGVSLASTMPDLTAQAVVALAALVAATAPAASRALLAVPDAGPLSLLPRRRAADVPLVLAGRTTDVVHHPARPRAPGLV